jgi:4-hydroxy-tetrahydrodipicolinate synthase
MPTPGLIVAPLTPFTADLTVDEAALRRQIDYVIDDCRATMVVAAGSRPRNTPISASSSAKR